jgi:hypothetical protein
MLDTRPPAGLADRIRPQGRAMAIVPSGWTSWPIAVLWVMTSSAKKKVIVMPRGSRRRCWTRSS